MALIYLLLEAHLRLMTFLWWNTAIGILLMGTVLSILKLILNCLNIVFRRIWHTSNTVANLQLLTNMKTILQNRSPVGFRSIILLAVVYVI